MQGTRSLLPTPNPSHLWGCLQVIVAVSDCSLSCRVLPLVAACCSTLPLLHTPKSV